MTATSFRSLMLSTAALLALGLLGCGGGASTEVAPPPEETPPPVEATPEPTPEAVVAAAPAGSPLGAELFNTYCSACHGATGHGDGIAAAALNPKPASFGDAAFWDADHNGHKHDDAQLEGVIAKGGAAMGLSPLMAPWAAVIDTPEKMSALIAHIKSLRQS